MRPFAGVMLALVAMVMLPVGDSHRNAARWASADLPLVYHPVAQNSANRDDALFVAVTRDGFIWFDQGRVSSAELPAKIRERLRRGAERKAYLRADAHTKYRNVVEVLDAMRAAGVEHIGILCYERPPQSRLAD
jgi:biopolymer transport protein ExbD